MRSWIDIEDADGERLGAGPIITATDWQHTARLDRAGTFAFSMPCTDPRVDLIQEKRIASCWTMGPAGLVHLGAGIIDKLYTDVGADNIPMLQVSGDDLLRELTNRSVHDLMLMDTITRHPVMAADLHAGAYDTHHAEWVDYQVGDSTTGASISLDFPAEFPDHWLYIRDICTWESITLKFSAVNTIPSVLIGQYYNLASEGWEQLNLEDGTAIDDAFGDPIPFAQNGTITFDPPADWALTPGGGIYYELRFYVETTINSVTITDIAITYRVPTDTALADVMALAPAGWALDAVDGYISTAPRTPTGAELVVYGTFESIAPGDVADDGVTDTFTGWTNQPPGVACGKIEAVTGAHGGIYALKLTNTTGFVLVYQDIDGLLSNTDYHLTFWAKGDGTHETGFRLQDQTPGSLEKFIINAVDTGITVATWTQYSYDFVTPATCTKVRLALLSDVHAGSAVYFDDMSLKAGGGGRVYLQMAGESVLETLVRIAEQTGEHFILSPTPRRVLWLRTDQRDTGLRAVSGGEPLALAGNTNALQLTGLTEQQDAYDLCSRVYPTGGGTGTNRVTLAHCTRPIPDGYTIDKIANYLKRDATETAIGRIERAPPWADINAVNETDTQMEFASNALFDQAYEHLRKNSCTSTHRITGDVPRVYACEVAECNHILLPGHLLRVVYRRMVGSFKALAIDASLWILGTTLRVDRNGARTVALTLATVDQQPMSDVEILTRQVRELKALRAHDTADAAFSSNTRGMPIYASASNGRVTSIVKRPISALIDNGTYTSITFRDGVAIDGTP